jgi:hypothetical protein
MRLTLILVLPLHYSLNIDTLLRMLKRHAIISLDADTLPLLFDIIAIAAIIDTLLIYFLLILLRPRYCRHIADY